MTHALPTRRLALAGLFASIALTGCSSTSGGGESGSDDGAKRYANAQKKLAGTSSYHVTVSSKGIPSDTSSLESGEGDVVNKPQSFEGSVKVNTGGSRVDATIVTVDKTSWVKSPLLGNTYREFTPSDFGVPEPSALFNANRGIPALPTKSKDLKKTGEKLVNGDKVTMFKGTVSGADAVAAMNFGRPRANYTVEVGLTSADELRVMTVTGPFFDAGDATYTLNFTNYGQKKTISKP